MTASGRLRAPPPPASPAPSMAPKQPRLRGRLGRSWADARALAKRAATACWALVTAQMDVDWLMYTLSERLHELPLPRRALALCALVLAFAATTFTGFFWLFTSGGDRWVINPVVSEFEFPLIPENALKVYACCKYLISICIAYNYAKYVLERQWQIVALMDALEIEADKAIGELRLDATVPRPGDNPRTREARELIAMRRLYWRGTFTFDVVPLPDLPTEPEPTEEELQLIREALELEAVKKLNDPKMLREYIRRRESRMGRRKVHLTKSKERRRGITRKALKMDTPLNVIKEEDSSSQLSNEGRRNIPHEFEHGYKRPVSRGRSSRESSSEKGEKYDSEDSEVSDQKHHLEQVEGRKLRLPLQAARWPVSGTCRSRGGEQKDEQAKNLLALASPHSRPCSPKVCDNPRSAARNALWELPSGDSSSKCGSSSQRSGRSAKRAKVALQPLVWNSLSQTMTPSNPPAPDTVVVAHDASAPAHAKAKAADAGGGAGGGLAETALVPSSDSARRRPALAPAPRHDKLDARGDSFDDLTCPSTSDEDGGPEDETFFSSGDSASISEVCPAEDLPEDCSCNHCRSADTWVMERGSGRPRCDLEIADLLQPRSGWSDSRSSLSGLSPSLTSTLTSYSDVTTSSTLTATQENEATIY